MKIRRVVLPLLALIFFLSSSASAEIIFRDVVGIKDKPIMLVSETKGKFFARGGEVVEFSVGGKSIGRVLSGGDGFAFREFTPKKTGLYKISVASGKDRDSGFLLSLSKDDSVVLIDVEGSIFIPLSTEPMEGSLKVIKAISRKFHVIYLHTGMLDTKTLKNLLVTHRLADGPLISWDEDLLDELYKNGVRIKFVIGGESVIEPAKKFGIKAYSFRDIEGAKEVKDWKDLGKKLRLVIK